MLFINDSDSLPVGNNGIPLLPRRTEFGKCEVAAPIPVEFIIPRDEWDERIADKNAAGNWLFPTWSGDVPCMDQNGLGYCHAYCTVMAAMVQAKKQNHPPVMLSAESIGGPITNWRNRGAHPEDDLEQMVKYGACPADMMDREHSISPSRWASGWETERKKFRVVEFWDGQMPGYSTFDIAASFALLNIPYASGHAWWGHAIAGGFGLRKESNGTYSLMKRNSWGPSYGQDGFFWLASALPKRWRTRSCPWAVRRPRATAWRS